MDRGIFKEVPLPCAFLDEVALERNIQSVIELSGDKKIRIASKSLRICSNYETDFSYKQPISRYYVFFT